MKIMITSHLLLGKISSSKIIQCLAILLLFAVLTTGCSKDDPKPGFAALPGDDPSLDAATVSQSVCQIDKGGGTMLGCQCQQDSDCGEDLLCNVSTGSCLPECDVFEVFSFKQKSCVFKGNPETICGSRGEGVKKIFWPIAAYNDSFVCQTEKGYYWDEFTLGPERCDADNDGWVRKSAANYLIKFAKGRALRDNARCTLHCAERIVLSSEDNRELHLDIEKIAGKDIQTSIIVGMLEDFDATDRLCLPLLEPDAIDEDDKVAGLSQNNNTRESMPKYGYDPDARLPKASELNSMTKACVAKLADYNQNGFIDVVESSEDRYKGDLGTVDGIIQYFAAFSYFIELHRSWFQPRLEVALVNQDETALANDQDPQLKIGYYYIKEKIRKTGLADWQPADPNDNEDKPDDNQQPDIEPEPAAKDECPYFSLRSMFGFCQPTRAEDDLPQEEAEVDLDRRMQLRITHSDPGVAGYDASWQVCRRLPDRNFNGITSNSYDFAEYGPYLKDRNNNPYIPEMRYDDSYSFSFKSLWMFIRRDLLSPPSALNDSILRAQPSDIEWNGWLGMNHSGQFKCVMRYNSLDLSGEYIQSEEKFNQQILPYNTFSRCTTHADSMSLGPIQSRLNNPPDLQPNLANPSDADIACTNVVETDLVEGAPYWAAVKYQHYSSDSAFIRGCMNQCFETRGRCGLCGLGNWTCDNGDFCDWRNSWLCGSHGLSQSCNNIVFPPDFTEAEIDCNDLDIASSTFVYVSNHPLFSAREQDGSRQKPFHSIQGAIDALHTRWLDFQSTNYTFSAPSKVLIVSTGKYEEGIVMYDNEPFSIYGGFWVGQDSKSDKVSWFYRSDGKTIIRNRVQRDGRIVVLELPNLGGKRIRLSALEFYAVGPVEQEFAIWHRGNGAEITQENWPENIDKEEVKFQMDGCALNGQHSIGFCKI